MRRMQTELSELERRVLMAGLEGRTPAQTAQELGLPAKKMANALAVPAASCAAAKTPKIQVICLHHINLPPSSA